MALPNILYMHAQDVGRLVSPYGFDVNTPNIRKLAQDGVVFRKAFAASSFNGPSQASLVSGQYPHCHGQVGPAEKGFAMRRMDQWLVPFLKSLGYYTALCGKQSLREESEVSDLGYDEVYGQADSGHLNACRFLNEPPQAPFFLDVGFGEARRPFPELHEEDDPRFVGILPGMPDAPELREDLARFKTAVRKLDYKMGTVMEALEQSGKADNTLVICTTDNGPSFPGMKGSLSDLGIGVMLIMRGPGGFNGGRVLDGLVSQVDLLPTLCDVIGVKPPVWAQGVSMLPLVFGELRELRESIFAEVHQSKQFEPMRCVRTHRWKLLQRLKDREVQMLENCEESVTKSCFLLEGWHEQPVAREALYDLFFDPSESRNLIEDAESHPVLDDLLGSMNEWIEAEEVSGLCQLSQDELTDNPDVAIGFNKKAG